MNLIYIAAPPASSVTDSLHGHPLAGSLSAAGVALCSVLALFFGLRGSDRIRIRTRDQAGISGFIVGTLCAAAGGMWASVVNGIGTAPTTLLSTSGSPTGNIGWGSVAIAITILTFTPKWKKPIWPALFGIAASVIYGQAEGIWGVPVDAVKLLAAKLGG